MTTTIAPMKKLKCSIQAGGSKGQYTLTPTPVGFNFIYGISSGGVTPFELAFADRSPGDILRFQVAQKDFSVFFGAFATQVKIATGMHLVPDNTWFEITIDAVEDADNREVVAAMAASLGHGCGGGTGDESCGCGCG